MKTRPDISLLSAEQLRLLVQELYAEVDEKDEVMEEVLFQQNEQTLAFAKQTRQLKLEKRKMQAKIDAQETEIQQLKERLFAAEARWKATKNTPPTTIIYGNHATSMYGSTIHEQKNTTNHQTKEDMNIENFYNSGEIKQLGDGNTMNVYEVDKENTVALSPSQDQMITALTRLAAGELSVGKIADTCWWGVHKFLSEYKLTNLNMAEFGIYLVNHHIQEKNIYNNFRQTGRQLTMLSRLKVADWGDVDGVTTEAAQRQIDVVKCLQKELCEEEPL